MSRASEYATRFKEATEVQQAAARARDGVIPVRLVLPAEGNTDLSNQYSSPLESNRVVAVVTAEGKLACQAGVGSLAPEDALKLARWILETFGETRDTWMRDLHHLDCAVWKLTKGDCTCGGLKFGARVPTPGSL